MINKVDFGNILDAARYLRQLPSDGKYTGEAWKIALELDLIAAMPGNTALPKDIGIAGNHLASVLLSEGIYPGSERHTSYDDFLKRYGQPWADIFIAWKAIMDWRDGLSANLQQDEPSRIPRTSADCRTVFEYECKTNDVYIGRHHKFPEQYQLFETQLRWMGWQAAWAYKQQPHVLPLIDLYEEGEILVDLINSRENEPAPVWDEVERVARAIFNTHNPKSSWEAYKTYDSAGGRTGQIELYIKLAKAAIAAMPDNTALAENNGRIAQAARNLFDNRRGWDEGMLPYAPRYFWWVLGCMLYSPDDPSVKILRPAECQLHAGR